MHVSSLYDKIVSKFGILVKTKHLFDTDTTLTLYRSLLIPVIDYCDTVNMVSQTSVNKLDEQDTEGSKLCLEIMSKG